jgi:hypothetical protein
MESAVLNAQDRGVTLSVGYSETNRTALQRAIDEMQAAGGGTIFVQSGVYEFAGTISMEVSTTASAAGTLHIIGEGGPSRVRQGENNLFVVTEAHDGSAVGQAVFERLDFQGTSKRQDPEGPRGRMPGSKR